MVFMVFRLELLLQIANKIQNGALNCEEKLTLAKNTLQAVSICSALHLMSYAFHFSLCSNSQNEQLRNPAVSLPFSWFPASSQVRAMKYSHPYILFLSQDAAHLESGQPVQCESDVIMYIQECEGLIRQLQVDLQILRDENYYQLEELAFR